MAQSPITAVILAGGLATRLGGVDKGLQSLAGEPLVSHVLKRIRPQAETVVINCNRNIEAYQRFGCPVIPDLLAGFPGPLAGLHAALHATSTPLLLTVPCDAPFLPADLTARLEAALGDCQAAVAWSGRTEPVFALYRRDILLHLEQFLQNGGRKVGQWQGQLSCALADFSEQAESFKNLNAAEDWPGTC